MTALKAARIATSVLPNPTSPQIRRSIERGSSMSRFVSAIALQLIGRFAERKRMLELELPFGVGSEGMAALGFALGLQREHLARVIENRGDGVLFRSRPFRVGQRTERR